jgi:hypothetical protein
VKATFVVIALVVAARPADAKGCHDSSAVVGYRHCTGFGPWSRDVDMPELVVDFGFLQHDFASGPFMLDGQRVPAAVATGASEGFMRILVGLGQVLYVGGEVGGGVLRHVPPLALGDTHSVDVMSHALVGVHVSPLFRFSFGAELAAGGGVAELSICQVKPCRDSDVDEEFRAELEARVIGEVWITPQLSLGVGVGKSLRGSDDTMWMVFFGGHLVPMDRM